MPGAVAGKRSLERVSIAAADDPEGSQALTGFVLRARNDGARWPRRSAANLKGRQSHEPGHRGGPDLLQRLPEANQRFLKDVLDLFTPMQYGQLALVRPAAPGLPAGLFV